jgi:hypothetical protein
MTSNSDPARRPEAVEFMQMIAAALEVDLSTTEGVKRFAYLTDQPERYVYRWRSGEHALSLRNAVAMLKAARLLESPAAAESVYEEQDPARLLAGLQVVVEQQGKGMAKALRGVTRRLERLEEAQANPAAEQVLEAQRARKASAQ